MNNSTAIEMRVVVAHESSVRVTFGTPEMLVQGHGVEVATAKKFGSAEWSDAEISGHSFRESAESAAALADVIAYAARFDVVGFARSMARGGLLK